MSFGDILNAWENPKEPNDRRSADDRKAMDDWLDRYPPGSEEAKREGPEEGGPERGAARSHLLRMRHEAELDLHGLRAEEALRRVDLFLADCHRRGLHKVLVIHGKGLHSEGGEAVLARAVRLHLQSHRLTGQLLYPPKKYGGRGALWVMLRD